MTKKFLFVDTNGSYEESAGAYEATEHVSTSAGVGDAGKPIVLDAAGQIDATMINDGDISHLNISDIGTNAHSVIDTHIADATIHFTEASIDHGLIAGLADDDHTQYILENGTRNFSAIVQYNSHPTFSADTDIVDKKYVDDNLVGLSWVDPVDLFNLIGNNTVVGINALSPAAGDQYVMTDAGTLTTGSLAVVAGDCVEYNGTAWIKLVSGSGGFVPSGTRAILSEGTIISPYTDATDNDKIVSFAGASNTGTDTGQTTDGVAILVQDPGHISIYDNLGYVYEGTVPSGMWIQFTGAANITAGAGLSKTTNTLDVNAGDGISIVTDNVTVDFNTSAGLKFVTNKLSVEPTDFAGAGLVDDGSDNLAIDWSTTFNDAKAIKAQNLNSVVNGEGASIIGIEDSGGLITAVNVEAALAENRTAIDAIEDNTITSTNGSITVSGTIGGDDQVVETTFSTSGASSRSIEASSLASVLSGEGASMIGVEDSGGNFTATTAEGVFLELFNLISQQGQNYTVGAGGVTKGDLVYISTANTVLPYSTLATFHKGIGVALTTEAAAASVKVLANDTKVTGLTIGGSPSIGDPVYWDGSGLTVIIPTGSGSHVWQAGVVSASGEMRVEVRPVKKNA